MVGGSSARASFEWRRRGRRNARGGRKCGCAMRKAGGRRCWGIDIGAFFSFSEALSLVPPPSRSRARLSSSFATSPVARRVSVSDRAFTPPRARRRLAARPAHSSPASSGMGFVFHSSFASWESFFHLAETSARTSCADASGMLFFTALVSALLKRLHAFGRRSDIAGKRARGVSRAGAACARRRRRCVRRLVVVVVHVAFGNSSKSGFWKPPRANLATVRFPRRKNDARSRRHRVEHSRSRAHAPRLADPRRSRPRRARSRRNRFTARPSIARDGSSRPPEARRPRDVPSFPRFAASRREDIVARCRRAPRPRRARGAALGRGRGERVALAVVAARGAGVEGKAGEAEGLPAGGVPMGRSHGRVTDVSREAEGGCCSGACRPMARLKAAFEWRIVR